MRLIVLLRGCPRLHGRRRRRMPSAEDHGRFVGMVAGCQEAGELPQGDTVGLAALLHATIHGAVEFAISGYAEPGKARAIRPGWWRRCWPTYEQTPDPKAALLGKGAFGRPRPSQDGAPERNPPSVYTPRRHAAPPDEAIKLAHTRLRFYTLLSLDTLTLWEVMAWPKALA